MLSIIKLQNYVFDFLLWRSNNSRVTFFEENKFWNIIFPLQSKPSPIEMNIKESPIPLPTDEVTDPYVFEERKKLSKKYSYDESKGGKWMMFVGKEFLNNVWLMAVRSYRHGELIGIRSIKSTTAQANEKSNGEPRGVISFHCGPYDNEKLIRKYGRNIKDKLTSQQIYRGLFGYLIYKSDQQTKDGIFRPKKGVKAKFRGKERCSLYRYLIGSGHSFTELDTNLVNSER